MEVLVLLRRFLCTLMIAAMLAAALPQAGLAMSAGEALFGDGASVPETPAQPVAPDAAADDGDVYGTTDSLSISQYPTLRLGDRDGDDGAAYIVFMQNRLIELGYLHDSADGMYGENTEIAVSEFQKNNGLDPTGVADPATQQKLFSDITTLVQATADNTKFGSETTRVQTALAMWGFYGSRVDGEMGSGTQSAIRTFKRYMQKIDPGYGATPTPAPTATPDPNGQFSDMPVVVDIPLANSSVADELDSRIDDALLSYVDGEKPFQIFRQTVRNGDEGSEALRVQTRLHQLNYLYAADGAFGVLSEEALKYFQRKNGLDDSGVADEQTQRVLFSTQAIEGEEYVFPYKIVVDISKQRVYVGKWTGAAYTELVKTFVCSTGKDETPTPTGTYQALGRGSGEWYYFKDYNCYAKWGYVIVGGILFHSVTYNSQKKLNRASVSNLGHKASHGCVRLSVDDAKWIYDHCPSGTTVVIQK